MKEVNPKFNGTWCKASKPACPHLGREPMHESDDYCSLYETRLKTDDMREWDNSIKRCSACREENP